MNDFLTRLAERSLGLMPQVRPLLASRFDRSLAAPVVPETLGEEQQLSLERSFDSAQVPLPQSRVDTVSMLEPLPHREAAEMQAPSRASAPAANASALFGEPTRPIALQPTLTGGVSENHAPARTTGDFAKAPPLVDEAVMRANSPSEYDDWRFAGSTESLRAQAARVRSQADLVKCEPSALASGELDAMNTALTPEASNYGSLESPLSSGQVQSNRPVQRDLEWRGEVPFAAPLPPTPRPLEQLDDTKDAIPTSDRLVADRSTRRIGVVRPRSASLASLNEPAAPARESGPPIVRVTIGRIEVRAILPPSKVERPVPTRATPGLSLDEYLKRHSEVKR